MADVEATTDDVTSAIERLLYGQQTQAPEAEAEETQAAPEPQPRPQPVQETDDEDEAPVDPDNAEVEGAVLETKSEPDKAVVAESPKAPEAPKTLPVADNTQQDQLLAQLDHHIPLLQAQIAHEFQDIKTDADLWRLGQEDPARYNRFILQRDQLGRAQQVQQQLRTDAQTRFMQTQVANLSRDFPEYVDPVKGQALRAEFTEYAKERGYSDAQMRAATATDILVLRDALEGRKLKAEMAAQAAKVAAEQAKAKEKAAKAPPVSRPGVATDEKRSKAQERFETFRKSGKPEDLAALLQEQGIA